MSINFDFRDLETFLAVKELGSFHLAAERLGISQSGVTRRIRKLEEFLNTELFERSTRRVKPTLTAKRLEPRAQAMLDEAVEATRAIRDESVAFEHQRLDIITVATVPTFVPSVLTRALVAFRKEGFNTRVRLLDSNANEVTEHVMEGEADFGIGSISIGRSREVFEVLFDDQMVATLPFEHPLARQDVVTWSDIAVESLMLPARATGNRLLIDDALATQHSAPRWTFECNRSTTMLQLVADGLGVAVLPRTIVENCTDARVIWRPIVEPRVSRPIGIVSRPDQTSRPAAARLKELVRISCSEYRPSA